MCTLTVINSMAVSQKTKSRTTYHQQFHSWIYIQKNSKMSTKKDIYTPLFIAALLTIDRMCKQPNCPSAGECIKKVYVVVQSPSHVWLFVTPFTVACQASLSLTISWSLPKFMSIELMMPSSHLICHSSAFNLS